MNKSGRPILAMLNALDESHDADAFVALMIDDARSPDVRLCGYEVFRAKADLGELGYLAGRDATRTTVEALVGSNRTDRNRACSKTEIVQKIFHADAGHWSLRRIERVAMA